MLDRAFDRAHRFRSGGESREGRRSWKAQVESVLNCIRVNARLGIGVLVFIYVR